MRDKLITIFGGGGFIGKYVAENLLSLGARLRIAERNPDNAKQIRTMGRLGQTQFATADIRNADSVRRAVHGADMVINLVGILDGDFTAFHVDGARNVAEAASEAGCEAMVQMSAIGADAQSDSRYGRSKGEGEAAVHEAFPGAIIMRPSIVFGAEDQFTNRFAALIAALPVVPIIGGKTQFQPVYVNDVARAVATVLVSPGKYAGKIFELGGPEIISMRSLNERIAEVCNRNPLFVDISDTASGLLANLTGWLPGAPITRDQWLMLQSDNVVSENARSFKMLGIAASGMSPMLSEWMVRYRSQGRFGAKRQAP
ncbi:MAG: complex I NDUFA9 subunit family protein [Pseudomonadota bacterium]